MGLVKQVHNSASQYLFSIDFDTIFFRASERHAGLKVKIEEKAAHLSSAVEISCTGSL